MNIKNLILGCLVIILAACQSDVQSGKAKVLEASVSNMSTSELHKSFHTALKKHINATSAKDFPTLKSVMHPEDKLYMMRPNTEVIYSGGKYLTYHQQWFKDENWTLEAKITDSEVGPKLGWALTEIIYTAGSKKNKLCVSYVMENVNGNWYVISDHSTVVKRNM